MRGGCGLKAVLLLGLVVLPLTPQFAQFDDPLNTPGGVPPPVPRRPAPEAIERKDSILPPEEHLPPLDADLMQRLKATARIYQDYARRFTCDEVVRFANYDAQGEASENVKHYAYTLLSDTVQNAVREYRQEQGRDGKLKGAVDDAEPFPPAYMWVQIFTDFHEPFFSFRNAGRRFDGFDLVHEIYFKGSLPWTDGRDIRQWEGRLLVDAIHFTPLLIEAEPSGQRERLDAMYRIWSQSFNILGFRTKKSPLGYRATVQFRLERDGLQFPTELRYDTDRAVSTREIVRVKSSTRVYKNYLFIDVHTQPEVTVDPPPSS